VAVLEEKKYGQQEDANTTKHEDHAKGQGMCGVPACPTLPLHVW